MMLEPPTRSSQSAVEAPSFLETTILHTVVTNNQPIQPDIQAKIQKGFFQVDSKWTCYRRNYFSVTCSFSLRPFAPTAPLYLQRQSTIEYIHSFAMSISAIVNGQDSEVRELVQHTPKRSKDTEFKPSKITLQPNQQASLAMHPVSTSASNPFGLGGPQTSSMALDYNSSYGATAQPSQIPTSHTFERIQFQKATANNGKRRAQQQFYNLVVELFAEVAKPNGTSEGQWVKIATKRSEQMVVRGRSPGHYKDSRRDSSASMGDGGGGSSGDGGGPVMPTGMGLGSRQHPSLVSYEQSQRGGTQGGRGDYRHMTSLDHSVENSSSSSSSSSSGDDLDDGIGAIAPTDAIASTRDVQMNDRFSDQSFHSPPPEFYDGGHKTALANNLNIHLPLFEYSSSLKPYADHLDEYNETYSPLVQEFRNDRRLSSQYLKRSAPDELSDIFHGCNERPTFHPAYGRRTSGSQYVSLEACNTSRRLCS